MEKEERMELIKSYRACILYYHIHYLQNPNFETLSLIYIHQTEYEKLTGFYYQIHFRQNLIKYIMTLTEITQTEMRDRLDALPDGQTDTNNLVQLVDYSMIVATKDNYQLGTAWYIKS